ncbi:MAG: phage terminase large subunit family protein, partial [Planctomycetes bacterium]|nr:phage terminase large subunit family protein [Planctomycetota bacterium]
MSQWADKYRILSPEYSAEPGPWRTSRVPYLREVMDSFCEPSVRHITFVKSAQVGGSECMNNIMLYSIDCAPGPTLYVMPAQDDAAEEATGRIKRMMEQCERIQPYIPFEGFASSKRIVLKGPRNIYMAWAKAHRTLIRRAIRYVWFDELDNLER